MPLDSLCNILYIFLRSRYPCRKNRRTQRLCSQGASCRANNTKQNGAELTKLKISLKWPQTTKEYPKVISEFEIKLVNKGRDITLYTTRRRL